MDLHEDDNLSLFQDLKSTALNVVNVKKAGTLETILSDKTRTLKAGVKALLNEIELRETLNRDLLNKIDDEVCRQNSYFYHLKYIPVQYSFELAKSLNKTKMEIEHNLMDLEKEKRSERLECWRDLMFLKKYLMSSLKDYWELVRRREVLLDDLIENENS